MACVRRPTDGKGRSGGSRTVAAVRIRARWAIPDPENAAGIVVPEESPTSAELFREALGLRPGEYGRTAIFFTYLMVASAIFIAGRTVRDTLFLSRYGISTL